VVVSNFVIHEVNTAAEREQLVSEMARVLKPGGRVALVDFIFTRGCVDTLRKCGIEDARRVRLGGFGAWMVTILMLGVFKMHLVTGSK
jgi:ubiquinone/menaquinone biosynthesis C-methylase UbiE